MGKHHGDTTNSRLTTILSPCIGCRGLKYILYSMGNPTGLPTL